jgi:hypothetical protein
LLVAGHEEQCIDIFIVLSVPFTENPNRLQRGDESERQSVGEAGPIDLRE